MSKFYKITSVCKEDIRSVFRTKKNNKAMKAIIAMTEGDMEVLAEFLSDDYLDKLYWISLRTIFEEKFLKGKK